VDILAEIFVYLGGLLSLFAAFAISIGVLLTPSLTPQGTHSAGAAATSVRAQVIPPEEDHLASPASAVEEPPAMLDHKESAHASRGARRPKRLVCLQAKSSAPNFERSFFAALHGCRQIAVAFVDPERLGERRSTTR
jgi:hypothetical protein